MPARVTAKNVGGVFLRHIMQCILLPYPYLVTLGMFEITDFPLKLEVNAITVSNTDFSNSFRVVIREDMHIFLKIFPPHLNCFVTLPWKINNTQIMSVVSNLTSYGGNTVSGGKCLNRFMKKLFLKQ